MKKKHLFLCLILTACGADTYEECVLDNIEDAKTPYAARLVTEACRAKFPNYFDKFAPLTKLNIGDKDNHFDKVKIEEIAPSQYDGASNLEITNYSPYPIKGVSLGILSNTQNTSCPSDTSQYSRFVSCTTQSSAFIEKNSTKPLYCDTAIDGEPFCLVTIYLE